jgi:hypothetical protein
MIFRFKCWNIVVNNFLINGCKCVMIYVNLISLEFLVKRTIPVSAGGYILPSNTLPASLVSR